MINNIAAVAMEDTAAVEVEDATHMAVATRAGTSKIPGINGKPARM
jgi:hypothetical protein